MGSSDASSIEIIPTVVPASFDDVLACVRRYPFARSVHVDFADGIFAPNTTWLPSDEGSYAIADVALEAHLMVERPRAIGTRLARGNFARIIGHIEAMHSEARDTLAEWKGAGAREAGIGILFNTPLSTVEPYLGDCDLVQMMSIGSIGVQGIAYERRAPERIAQLHGVHPDLLIADDGGVGEGNIVDLVRAGVRRFCVGSALAKAQDPKAMYERLLALAESAI